jgi:DUF1680 family protein
MRRPMATPAAVLISSLLGVATAFTYVISLGDRSPGWCCHQLASPNTRILEVKLAVSERTGCHSAVRALAACLLASMIPPLLGETAPAPDVFAVRSFAFGDVRLLDGPFRSAMERNVEYLLSIEPDRLLHNTRKYAGLAAKGDLYGGWESAGVAGHILGHYLTAISQQYATTGDMRLKARIDYIVTEMDQCQKLYGDGYIGALPPLELSVLRGFKKGIIEPSGPHTFKGGAWVPWYTEHKVLSGLKDAWILGGNSEAKVVVLKLADWVDDITVGLTPSQLQLMLSVEHGGMIDVLAELYALTGNPRYLEASRRFYHAAVLDPLLAGRDELRNHHANTQIPKIIGEARTFEVTGEPQGRRIAEYFWDRVVHNHSWVIGGNSDNEYFFGEGEEKDHLSAATAETCNTYNMLKLTTHLFEWEPRVEYADFYERALYNDILASQDPDRGMFTYFMSLKPGTFKTYSTPFDSFWCCVGTGMENHTQYGTAIYYHAPNALYIDLFIPSELRWNEKGLILRQQTEYPRGDRVVFTFQSEPTGPIELRVRCPGWATAPVLFELNGQRLDVAGSPGTFAAIRRAWRKGDRLTAVIPMAVRLEALPEAPDSVAFLFGPAVLAGDLGPVLKTDSIPYSKDQRTNLAAAPSEVPVLVRGNRPLEASLVRSQDGSLVFHTTGLSHPVDMTLRPFWEISHDRYNVYWEVMTQTQWTYRDLPASPGQE